MFKAKRIYKSYDSSNSTNNVIVDVSLNMKSGDIVCIMGPSGSGKSTLINMFGSLLRPDKGEIYINDSNIYKDRNIYELRRKNIGLLFQNHYLLPEFNVMENLLMPSYLLGRDEGDCEKIIRSYLSNLNLGEKIFSYPHELSGGELQRISLIRSIINNPQIVFADEPTGNLDYENSILIINLIKELSNSLGMAFCIATHDQNFCDIANSIYELKKGKLLKVD